MKRCFINFNEAALTGNEMAYIAEAIDTAHISGDGPFSKRCQDILEGTLGVRQALVTTSCTHALEITALLLDLKPGDEFIVPSFAYVTTASAFALRGARPVFIDIRPDTLNMDETHLEALISSRTKAIIPIHYAGVGCEMDSILNIASRHGIPVVEDNAHGLYGKYKGKFLGTLGCLATQSFHETKNFTCGEGGALLINDDRYVERAQILREKGTNRSRFFRGQVDKYTWVDLGSSYVLSDILAAFLCAQLEARGQIQAWRRSLWTRYYQQLAPYAQDNRLRLPVVPAECEQPYHMFYILLSSLQDRLDLIAYLKQCDILSVFHYLPLHLSDMGRRLGGREGDCPVTEDVSDRLLRLPLHNRLTEEQQARIMTAIGEFFARR